MIYNGYIETVSLQMHVTSWNSKMEYSTLRRTEMYNENRHCAPFYKQNNSHTHREIDILRDKDMSITSTTNDSFSCCVSGHIHTGEPKGTLTKIAGLDTYMAQPDQFTGRAVLFIHDAFGLLFANNKLLADTYAKQAGVLVVLPDFFEGDPVPESALKTGQFDFMSWVSKHGKDHCYPMIENVAKELREKHGVTKLAAIGFCWGGWGTLKLGATDLADAVAVAHPSMLDMPADVENLKKPALFLCAEVDQQFPEEKRKAAQEILQKKGLDATFEFYPGTTHGFAVRFNTDDQVAAKAAEDAKNKAVAFFKKNLA